MEKPITKKKRFPVWVIILISVVLVGGTIGGFVIANSLSPERRAEKQLELARKYISELNYEQAIIAYEAAIELDRKNIDAYLELAELYVEIGEPEKANEVLDNALDYAHDEDVEEIEKEQEKISRGDSSASPGDPTTPDPTGSAELPPVYEPAPTLEPMDDETREIYNRTIMGLMYAEAGYVVTFGSYEQDNDPGDGSEPIEWIVLSNDGSEMFLLSKYALDCKPYNEGNSAVTWETCTLRKWLNEDFFNSAFNGAEQRAIKRRITTNPDNPEYGTPGGNNTEDRVFLPSIEEMLDSKYDFTNKYYDSDEYNMINRRCSPTAFAKAKGVETWNYHYTEEGEEACFWWLRSPGYRSNYATRVYDSGYVYSFGLNVNYENSAVRPALIIDLK